MLFVFANAILLYLSPDPCEKVLKPSNNEIAKLDQIWHVSPAKLRNTFYCKDDKKEYYYIKQKDKASYVALTKVKITKESSCRNNSLFNGKRKLFLGMIQSAKVANPNLPQAKESYLLKKIISVNDNSEHASTLQCFPLNTKNVKDPDDMWDECECVLYGFFPNGIDGILNEIVDK